jgi:hypothetical protein
MTESGDRHVPSLLSQEKRRYRRAFWTGLGISTALHAALFLWTAGQVRFGAARFEALPPTVAPPQGIQVIEVRPLTPEEAQAREEQRLIELRETERETPAPEEEAPGGEPLPPRPPAARGEEEGRGLTNAEKLQPRIGDRQLWGEDYDPSQRPEYLTERMPQAEQMLRSYLGRMLDSLQLSEEQRRKAVEWLLGDDEDWGVTPDGITLGGVEIPMNVGAMFQEEGPNGRESRQLARDQDLIDRQDLAADVEATLEERNRAMEARADSSRVRSDSAAAADSASGPP